MLNRQRRMPIASASGILMVLLACLFPLRAAETPSHFEQANRHYEQGNYQGAITLYENMIAAGRSSPGIFFNLGNAWFKAGSLGHAIHNYHQASALSPRDPDIQTNLRFARERVSGSASIESPFWHRPFFYFKINELAGLAAAAFWGWLVLLVIGKVRPSLAPMLRPAILATGTMFGVALLYLLMAFSLQDNAIAIVTTPRATVRLGPVEESQSAFTVADGTELRVEAARDEWIQVSDRTGRSGWMPRRELIVFKRF